VPYRQAGVGNSDLRAATLGANWVYWPSDFGEAKRRSPPQANLMFAVLDEGPSLVRKFAQYI
jgi:hypothetical protein